MIAAAGLPLALFFFATVEEAMKLAARGDFAGAEAELSTYLREQPRDADAHYRLGIVRMRRSDLDGAQAALAEAVRIAPRLAIFHLAQGELELRRQNRRGAGEAAARAAGRAGEDASVWRGIAALQARAGDGLGQARSLQKIIELAPADRAAHVRLVTLFLEHRTADAAAAGAAAALAQFPDDAELLRLRGLAEYAAGRKPEAVRSFLASIDRAPDDEAGYASLETLLPEASVELMPDILKRLRPFAARNPLGAYLLALAAPVEAEAQLRRAIEQAPDFWPAQYELGRLLRDRGERTEAIVRLNRVLQLNPQHAESHYLLAQLEEDREQSRRHRAEHHRLRQEAARAERQRAAEKPRLAVKIDQ